MAEHTVIRSVMVDVSKLAPAAHTDRGTQQPTVYSVTSIPPSGHTINSFSSNPGASLFASSAAIQSTASKPREPREFEIVVLRDAEGMVGVGLQKTSQGKSYAITSMIRGSPATGLIHLNDELTHVNSISVAGKSVDDVISTVNGQPGTTVNLTVRRGGNSIPTALPGLSPAQVAPTGVPISLVAKPVVPNNGSSVTQPAVYNSVSVAPTSRMGPGIERITIQRSQEGLLGIEFKKATGAPYKIVRFYPQSPAASRLQVDDDLLEVAGTPLDNLTPEQVTTLVRGTPFSNVELLIRRHR